MEKPKNPFIVKGYAGSEYFCDRKDETQKLIRALSNGRDVTLISPRRLGKSGLIHHAFAQIRNESPEVQCFYLDIFNTHNLKDFIQVFANALLGAFDNKIDKFFQNITNVLSHCRPVIGLDEFTGLPNVKLDIIPGEENITIEKIFQYLVSSGRRIYIAIDEFQQIASYPETGTEALLRGYIQWAQNISFIFSGSKKHLMQQMFTMPQRPFYQSTQTLSLKGINKEEYRSFAQRLFEKDRRKISDEAFDYIYDTVMGHTWYVQYWLNQAFEMSEKVIDLIEAKQAIGQILEDEDDNFYNYLNLLTDAQQRILIAIAKDRIVTEPYAVDFIKQNDLPSTSTIRSAISRLIEKEFLLDNRGEISVYNRFFMLWLARKLC